MPVFRYQGRNADGAKVEGSIEATSMDNVASRLSVRGVVPVSVELEKTDAAEADLMLYWKRRKKVKTDELIMFARQMYTITRSGIPLIRSVRGIADTVHNLRLKEALNDIADRLETGMALSVAMQPHVSIFGPMFISIIQVGEDSGNLDAAFLQLSEYLQRDLDTARQIKTALRYPSFVLIAFVIAIAVVNIWVVPAFAGLFERMGNELPLPTRILMTISDFFVTYWPALLVMIVIGFFAARKYLETEEGQLHWSRRKLLLPVIGDVVTKATLSRYARSISIMLNAGVAMNRAMELSSQVVDNAHMAKKIREIRFGIERGENMLSTHTASEMFTPLVLQMIAVGEQSGQVGELLAEVAEFYEREVDYDLTTLTSRIEPIMILMMAGFALVLALGIFLPMWDLYSVQS